MVDLSHVRQNLLDVSEYAANPTFASSIDWEKKKRADILSNANSTDSKVCIVVGIVADDRLLCGPVGGYDINSRYPQELEKARYSLFLRKPAMHAGFAEDFEAAVRNTDLLMKDIAISNDHRYFQEKVGKGIMLKFSAPVFDKKVNDHDFVVGTSFY